MQSYQIRRAVIIVVGVILAAALLFTMINFLRNVFSTTDTQASPDNETIILTDYDNDSSALRLTTAGPIVALEEFYQLRITVSSDKRIVEVIRGYDGRVVKKKTFGNTGAAYQSFIRAANYEGFMTRQKNNLGDDGRGVCPDGDRTTTQLFDDGQEIGSLWAVSCSKKTGTLAGDRRELIDLFEAQIPDLRDIVKDYKI